MKIKHLLFSILSTYFLLVYAEVAGAQILPSQGDRVPVSDNTLNTQVNQFGNNYNITGGLQRGQNVFHSFSDFSVPTNGRANFFNPAGNQSIISRVTGNIFSDINGLVNTNGANFFLINPNGIIFGPNARFDVGKSFVATTANSIDLVDGNGGRYNFGARNGNDTPLISVNSNVLFNVDRLNIVNGNNSGIINYGNINLNNPGQYIGLIGGNINLLRGSISAPGGRIDLGGINTTGAVSIGSTGLLFAGENIGRSDVFMRNGASVSVRARDTLTTVDPVFFTNATSNGSSINIGANNVDLVNAGANSSTQPAALDAGLETNSGVKTNRGGDININATGLVSLNRSAIKNTIRPGAEGDIGGIRINSANLNLVNTSFLSTILGGKGSIGDIEIITGGLNILNGSQITSETLADSQGNAGDIDIRTTGNILISGGSDGVASISSDTAGTGDSGKISIDAQGQGKLILSNGAEISSNVDATGIGNGQNIIISAQGIDLSNGSLIRSVLAGKGDAGNIDIKTKGDIQLKGGSSGLAAIGTVSGGRGSSGLISIDTQGKGKLILSDNAAISSAVSRNVVGNAQGIKISAKEIEVSNGSAIFSDNFGVKGNAGKIDIKTTGDIRLTGGTGVAGISSSNSGEGNSGEISIDTQGQGKLILTNNAEISNNLLGTGQGQNITISAQGIDLSNRSLIRSVLAGKGKAGNIKVETKGDIQIKGGSGGSSGIGTITDTNGEGDGGDISIVTQGQGKLILSDGAGISSSNISGKKGNAGKINIKTTGDISLNGGSSKVASIISSNNGEGNSGEISIDTQGQGKLILTDSAKISNSLLGTGQGQNITISAQGIDLSNGSLIAAILIGEGKAGNIDIETTGDINISGSTPSSTEPIANDSPLSAISTQTSGKGDAGKITINSKGKLSLSNNAAIISAIGEKATGNSQGISISAREIDLRNNALIFSSNLGGTGNAGNIDINKTGDIRLDGGTSKSAAINSDTRGKGNAGKISIDAKGDITLTNQGEISSTIGARANGNGQGIEIKNARNLSLDNRSVIKTITEGAGNAGNIDIQVNGKFEANDISTVQASTTSDGNAGNVTLKAESVTLLDGAEILALTEQGKGKAGNLEITTPSSGFIKIIGTSPSGRLPDGRPGGFSSGLFASAEKGSSSLAGKITVTTGTLDIENGGVISARNRSENAPNPPESLSPSAVRPGSITVDAKNINLKSGGQILTTSAGNAQAGDVIIQNNNGKIDISGKDDTFQSRKDGLKNASFPQDRIDFAIDPVNEFSGIFANNRDTSTGNGGSVTIQNAGAINIGKDGKISASNEGTGIGGNISITNSKTIGLNGGTIEAKSSKSRGGNIDFKISENLLMQNGGNITTNSNSSSADGKGGNITIDSPIIVATPNGNSNITANANGGKGGEINITSQGLFGIGYRANGENSPLSNDITASSRIFGQSGKVSVNTPDVDPGKDSAELPKAPPDKTNQVTQACSPSKEQNTFYVTGRGGKAPTGEETLSGDEVWLDDRNATTTATAPVQPQVTAKRYQPAQGWAFDADGKVRLIAAADDKSPVNNLPACPPVTPPANMQSSVSIDF